ncbi:FUN14 domain-containing protein [Leucothrix mucor]|uniref:FUN14 domain-containing protein n=1 Tax=Leucothrix mucor TaxID=45248 RepID=UPI0003B55E43|nr:FUN14 domain-containing protein [Leucothrix mucor]
MEPQQTIEAGNWVALAAYMGFSFFVGFAIGFAARTFLKVLFFAAGTLFIALFLLQYNGIINVNWDSFEGVYNNMIAWVSPHLGGLKNFITANLSSAAMAGLGLVLGLRRK